MDNNAMNSRREEMKQQSDGLKTIEDLRGKEFIVTSYQRGYRWGKREVEALLEDVWDFAGGSKSASFYCLQPIVVKKVENQYKIIDGQQRLTTIFLIIKFLDNENYFDISYETRVESKEFLQNIQSKTENEASNLDFYHFWNAFNFIKGFFNENVDKEKFKTTLLEKCKILWYQIAESENENDVFMRLNMGKIPLVEAENIKALFLSKNDELEDDDLIKERAQFWYESEIGAREKRDFRYCVLNKIDDNDIDKNEYDKPSLKDDILRIEAYLKAIVPYKKDKYYLFDHFYECYKKGTLNDKWEELDEAIRTLSGFASDNGSEKIDREIFHYLGFLTLSGENIYSLYKIWKKDTSKKLFAKNLLSMIKNKISNIKNFKDLSYDEKEDKENIKNILLLFNLEYLIREESSNEYFKFNRFVLEQWSLEHIYAQNSESIKEAIDNKKNKEIIAWLKETLLYIDDDTLKQEIEQSKEETKFDNKKLFNKINEHFKNDEDLHKIQNLTLLDKSSNSQIGNQIFSKKRLAIQKLAEQDKFMPITTRKVFEKVFSKSNPDVFTKKDQKDYLATIQIYLKKYMGKNT